MAIDQDALKPAERRYLNLAKRFRSVMPENPAFVALRGARTYAGTEGLLEFQDAMVLAGEWVVVDGICRHRGAVTAELHKSCWAG